MSTLSLPRFLWGAGLFVAGAFCGVLGVRELAPEYLSPAPAQAASSSDAGPPIAPPTTAHERLTPLVAPPAVAATSIPTPTPTSAPVSVAPPQPVAAAPPDPFISEVDQTHRRNLIDLLAACRAQLYLYKLQHRDKLPEFSKYPAWHQMLHKTRADGTIAADGTLGPYLKNVPVNPLNGFGSIGLVKSEPKPGKVMPGKDLGFVFCVTTGRLFATAKDGKTIFDDSSNDPRAANARASATAP